MKKISQPTPNKSQNDGRGIPWEKLASKYFGKNRFSRCFLCEPLKEREERKKNCDSKKRMKMKKAWFVQKKGPYYGPEDEYDFLGFGEKPKKVHWCAGEFWISDPFYIWVPIQATELSARRRLALRRC